MTTGKMPGKTLEIELDLKGVLLGLYVLILIGIACVLILGWKIDKAVLESRAFSSQNSARLETLLQHFEIDSPIS